MSTLTLRVKRLDNNAKLPARAKASDSGFDLCSIEDKVIYPEETLAIRTGIAVQCSEPVSIEVWPRSGLSLKGWLVHRSLIAFDPGAGLIDPGYTGEIRVVIHNVGVDPIHVQAGMRIAQLKFSPLLIPIVEEVDRLGETDRGADGFGSTGHSTVEDARPDNSQPYFTIDNHGYDGKWSAGCSCVPAIDVMESDALEETDRDSDGTSEKRNAMEEFEKELTVLINRHNIERKTDMPDFMMSEMICRIIESIGQSVKKTLDWHGCDSICHRSPHALNGVSAGVDSGLSTHEDGFDSRTVQSIQR